MSHREHDWSARCALPHALAVEEYGNHQSPRCRDRNSSPVVFIARRAQIRTVSITARPAAATKEKKKHGRKILGRNIARVPQGRRRKPQRHRGHRENAEEGDQSNHVYVGRTDDFALLVKGLSVLRERVSNSDPQRLPLGVSG